MEYFRLLLPILQTVVIVSLAFTAGLSSCLSLWVIPVIMSPENTSRSMIAQFDDTVGRGERYLQPGSRAMAAATVCLAILTWLQPDKDIAAKWKYYAIAGVVVAQVAWFEIMFIFPINREIRAMSAKIEGKEEQSLPDAERKKLISRLESWKLLNSVRVLLPLLSSCICLAAVL